MKLTDLKQGQIAHLKAIHMSKEDQKRLLHLGCYIGMQIQLVRYAPLRDPGIYSICGNDIMLRRKDAQNIEVEVFL